MKQIIIQRQTYTENEVLGKLYIFDESGIPVFECFSLELAWRDNQKNISCVPAGTYQIVKEFSPRFEKDLWELKGVPNRNETKIHVANFHTQLNGCIAIGSNLSDINNDNELDVTNSRNTLNIFHQTMGNDTKAVLDIVGVH
ncbi:DUF5675 family protein [Aquimarina sp. 2304DJ70-9]|uniref:DUF5675 family protein n=1 Tax=Aquimarina penaris TaxID=3231044 RepID=UPI003462DFEE